MKQTIYIDVLISINLFIDYFLILSVAKILNLKLERKKIVLASFIGSLYSLFILLPEVNIIVSLLCKLLMSVTIIFLGFGFGSLKKFLKAISVFYGINFIFGGIIFLLWSFVTPNSIYINNGMAYLNISPLFLIISTLVAYCILRIISKLSEASNSHLINCNLLINNNNKSVTIQAKIDTGNTLKEPFSGIPVIVTQFKKIEEIIPNNLKDYFYKYLENKQTEKLIYNENNLNGLRLVPFKTISGDGLLPAFKPNYIKILSDSQNVKKEAYVAICKKNTFHNEYEALINSELID